uniref:Uncharacterized protein n=1 Tax=Cannabis sativa TaxID=3483 RepID=A0A803PSP4_CANSA
MVSEDTTSSMARPSTRSQDGILPSNLEHHRSRDSFEDIHSPIPPSCAPRRSTAASIAAWSQFMLLLRCTDPSSRIHFTIRGHHRLTFESTITSD